MAFLAGPTDPIKYPPPLDTGFDEFSKTGPEIFIKLPVRDIL